MRPTIQSFYREFYGHSFFRHFRRPHIFLNESENNRFRIQFNVKTPKQIYHAVHRNSGLFPCLTHVYDHERMDNLKRNSSDHLVFDRVFFDFDVIDSRAEGIKKKLENLRKHGLNHQPTHQQELTRKLRKLIINERIAKPAINEAKDFSIKFKSFFGGETILFFSGGKGCHVYTFFEPMKHTNINLSLAWFGKKVKEAYKYHTLDLSVLKDAKSRLSRVPYSKHQLTGLKVVPFALDDNYDVIMEKTTNKKVEHFNKDEYLVYLENTSLK